MLKNKYDVIDRLAEMILELEIDRDPIPIDIYLYVDDEGNGSLRTFLNPGGNSWLDDDHYTIWSTDGVWANYFNDLDLDDISEIVGIDKETIRVRTAKAYDCDIDRIDIYDVYDYVESNDELMDKIIENYNDILRDNMEIYEEAATNVVEEYERRAKYE